MNYEFQFLGYRLSITQIQIKTGHKDILGNLTILTLLLQIPNRFHFCKEGKKGLFLYTKFCRAKFKAMLFTLNLKNLDGLLLGWR